MWPTSTYRRMPGLPFRLRVSIAQARCGLLPHTLEDARRFLIRVWFQSLKRDVAYFHSQAPFIQLHVLSFNRSSAMWPTSTGRGGALFLYRLVFQSLKRDVAYFHQAEFHPALPH